MQASRGLRAFTQSSAESNPSSLWHLRIFLIPVDEPFDLISARAGLNYSQGENWGKHPALQKHHRDRITQEGGYEGIVVTSVSGDSERGYLDSEIGSTSSRHICRWRSPVDPVRHRGPDQNLCSRRRGADAIWQRGKCRGVAPSWPAEECRGRSDRRRPNNPLFRQPLRRAWSSGLRPENLAPMATMQRRPAVEQWEL